MRNAFTKKTHSQNPLQTNALPITLSKIFTCFTQTPQEKIKHNSNVVIKPFKTKQK